MEIKKSWILLSLVLTLHCTTTLSQRNINNQISAGSSPVNTVSHASQNFALNIFHKLASAVSRDSYDFMISPYSIWTLLALIAEGANGNTLSELQRVLGINTNIAQFRNGILTVQKQLNINTEAVQNTASQILFSDVTRTVYREYQTVVSDYYNVEISPVDFRRTSEAQNVINNRVSRLTNGLIDYLVNEEDLLDANLVLVSTLFFKGQWGNKFNSTLTKPADFYDEQEKPLGKVEMMYQKSAIPYAIISEIDSHVVELPYGNDNRMSMILLLPRKGVHLTDIIGKIPHYGVDRIMNELEKAQIEYGDDEIELLLPKFTTTTDFVLNVVLEEMGINDLFDSRKSDLTKLTQHPIYLSSVMHKTQIEVNEEGTVASAASGAIFVNKITPPRIVANRPFAYLIVEKTSKSIVFCGQIVNPTKK